MFIVNTNSWPLLLVHATSDWDDFDRVQEGIDQVIGALKKAKEEKIKVILIFRTMPVENPPLMILGRIVAAMLAVKHLLKETLEKTIVRYATEEDEKFLGWLLYFYVPVRPLYKANTDQLVSEIVEGKEPEGTLQHKGYCS